MINSFDLVCDKCSRNELGQAHVLVEKGWEWSIFNYKDNTELMIIICGECKKKYPNYMRENSKRILKEAKE